ncbi:MAG TPA: RNA methyltransferase [Bacillota bacterium]|nr:RNA methyltransferase [Bacillota bacterium]HOK68121.1 RNA methyltransferase [Bacillota bacterium]HPP84423.1 RNA methyltransferase [Bacillota bacterium]
MLIESRNNERIKNIVKLRDRQAREKQRLFFFEGVHLLEEYLRHGHVPESVFVSVDQAQKYKELLGNIDRNRIFTVTREVFEKISTEKAPQGILTLSAFLDGNAIFLKDDYAKLTENNTESFLFLESVRDNGNVGTILRTAAALGVRCVLSSDCADIYSHKTVRATMGALFSSAVYIADDFAAAVSAVRAGGKRVFAAALGTTALTLGEFCINRGDCFVVGNEGGGISARIIGLCDNTVMIPMTSATESLNASAAAAILLWELRKASS